MRLQGAQRERGSAALGPDVGGVGGSLYGSNFPYDFVDSYKYGISFQVEVTGQLGKFDY